MSPRIKRTGKALPRVRSTSRRAKRIEPAVVADALGADVTSTTHSKQGSPPALFALRQELACRLTSTGGRRGLAGATRRQKIPLDDDDWSRLQDLAQRVADKDVRPTAGQVAGVLLHKALEEIDEAQVKRTLRRSGTRSTAKGTS